MSGGIGLAARLLALALFVVIAAGVYAFMLRSDLEAAQVQLTKLSGERDTYKTRLDQYVAQGKDDAMALQSCQAQVADLQAQVEAASKKGGRR